MPDSIIIGAINIPGVIILFFHDMNWKFRTAFMVQHVEHF